MPAVCLCCALCVPALHLRHFFPSLLLGCVMCCQADILDMALVEGNSPTLATVSDDGEVCLWNVDSCTLRRRLSPAGHSALPANEQPLEAVRFLKSPLHHVFVTVRGARGVSSCVK